MLHIHKYKPKLYILAIGRIHQQEEPETLYKRSLLTNIWAFDKQRLVFVAYFPYTDSYVYFKQTFDYYFCCIALDCLCYCNLITASHFLKHVWSKDFD